MYSGQGGLGAAYRRERITRETRPEIGTTDAKMHDVGEALAGRAYARAVVHGHHQRAHPLLRGANSGDDIGAVDYDRRVVGLPQGRVQGGPPLGEVDLFTTEQRVDPGWKIGVFHVADKGGKRAGRQTFLGKIGEPPVEGKRQRVDAPVIPGHQVLQSQALQAVGFVEQLLRRSSGPILHVGVDSVMRGQEARREKFDAS